jgi:hypothetical protein
MSRRREIEFAIEVFVRGHAAGRSRTFPYEASRVGPLWVMRDAPRKNPRDYRKEEWIAHGLEAREVDAIARRHTRGRFFVCAMVDEGSRANRRQPTSRWAIGCSHRGFFVQRLKRIPKAPSPCTSNNAHTRAGGAAGKLPGLRPSPTTCSWMTLVPPIYSARREGHCGPRAQCGCGGSDVVCRHVR